MHTLNKAAILVEQNKPLVVTDIDIPELSVGQVLVQVKYSGICGKQLDEHEGRQPDKFLPHLLGHEGSGIVVDIGAGVKKVKEGDHVVLHWMKGSGIDSEPPRFKWGDKSVSAGWVTTFNEYAIVSENRVTKILENVKLDVAALLGCAVTTGLGIVLNNANLKPGQSIAVFGCGGVGLNVIQGANLVNAYPIVGFDTKINKYGIARNFGAHFVWNELTDEEFDVTVDTTGIKSVREAAFDHTKKGGKCIFAGVPRFDEPITIDSYPIHAGVQIIGSHGGATNPDVDIPRYLGLYDRGVLKLDEQITHRFPLEKINEAMEVVKRGEAGRCLIWMNEA
uniref:Putative alcohol dehydrogenase n=1 Tax=viral metagenome TaxID=1070528 RepID=A0A6M3J846_9ZZZZ